MFNRIAACLVVCFLIGVNFGFGQSRYRVNNNLGASADFTDLQSAVTAAVNGDILIIEHSDIPYNSGVVNINKELTLYGTGYFLTENPGLQADNREANIGDIDITVSGVDISGLTMGNVNIEASSVNFERNLVTKSLVIGATNPSVNFIEIKRCYFLNNLLDTPPLVLVDIVNGTGLVFSNNVVWNQYPALEPGNGNFRMAPSSSGLVSNNIFYGGALITLHNVTFKNNVLEDCQISALSSNVSASNNYAEFSTLGTYQGSDNIVETDSTFSVTTIASRDRRFELRTDIPNVLIGAGSDGSDVGIFGGGFSYVISGIPKIPTIYGKDQENVTEDGQLEIDLKTRTNN